MIVAKTKKFKTEIDDLGRICTACGEYKLWEDFKGHSRSATGRSSKCKECYRANRKSTGRKKERYSAKKRLEYLKKNEPYVWKSRIIRDSLLRRGNKDTTPSAEDIKKWLEQSNLCCYYSGEQLTIYTITIDHKVPVTRGGDNILSNLCIASHHMNTAKGQMTDEEFISLLELISTWEDKGAKLLSRLKQGHF